MNNEGMKSTRFEVATMAEDSDKKLGNVDQHSTSVGEFSKVDRGAEIKMGV